MDKNSDGKITRDEAPSAESFRAAGFPRHYPACRLAQRGWLPLRTACDHDPRFHADEIYEPQGKAPGLAHLVLADGSSLQNTRSSGENENS